jgi:hypothetical protein
LFREPAQIANFVRPPYICSTTPLYIKHPTLIEATLEIIITPPYTFTLGSRHKGERVRQKQIKNINTGRLDLKGVPEISSNVKMNSTAFFCMLPDRRT